MARAFLFLQGPHGPFFCRLGQRLREAGHGVERINLNGGDRCDWPNAHDFRGRRESWASFLDQFLADYQITDLVLFGDSRPMHRIAHGVATMRGVLVHVMEEGYLRPDFVTLERHGVNGNSRLPRDPDYYRRHGAALPAFKLPDSFPGDFRTRLRTTTRYGFATFKQTWRFPHFVTHRPYSLVVEALGWTKRLILSPIDRSRTRRVMSVIADRPYYALPLQLNSDYQLRVHSSFGDMRAAVGYIIRSFARNAPADTLLVVKRHPLDPHVIGWAALVARMARSEGVGDRVLFQPGGDVMTLVAGSRGVVTVNSTVGTLALNIGIPVHVIGQAVYAIKGITSTGHLDNFWTNPRGPDIDLYEAFRRVIVDRCLLEGNFLSDQGQELILEGAVQRLTAA
jgi:capsular polysaccharide export protein